MDEENGKSREKTEEKQFYNFGRPTCLHAVHMQKKKQSQGERLQVRYTKV